MPSVIGISEHNGWAELVTVAVQSGAPVILDRRRAELIGPRLPRNPYHHEGLELPLVDAEKLIERVRRSVVKYTRAALYDLQSCYNADAIVLQRSPFEKLPESLAEVLESWRLTCAADGMMYREALATCAASLCMKVDRYPRKSDEVAAAAEAFGVTRETVAAVIKKFGRNLGSPWKQEHRNAAASALRVLAQCGDMRLGDCGPT